MWQRLRLRYYDEWLRTQDSTAWYDIRIKLNMIDDLREEMRKIDNG